MQPIRTFLQIPVQIKITLNEFMPIHQKLASKIKELKALGMTNVEIAFRLKINNKIISKALNN